jgi:hypothetical protein
MWFFAIDLRGLSHGIRSRRFAGEIQHLADSDDVDLKQCDFVFVQREIACNPEHPSNGKT